MLKSTELLVLQLRLVIVFAADAQMMLQLILDLTASIPLQFQVASQSIHLTCNTYHACNACETYGEF
jgi:hypothetical protein